MRKEKENWWAWSASESGSIFAIQVHDPVEFESISCRTDQGSQSGFCRTDPASGSIYFITDPGSRSIFSWQIQDPGPVLNYSSRIQVHFCMTDPGFGSSFTGLVQDSGPVLQNWQLATSQRCNFQNGNFPSRSALPPSLFLLQRSAPLAHPIRSARPSLQLAASRKA